jgi:hypothetical protein
MLYSVWIYNRYIFVVVVVKFYLLYLIFLKSQLILFYFTVYQKKISLGFYGLRKLSSLKL